MLPLNKRQLCASVVCALLVFPLVWAQTGKRPASIGKTDKGFGTRPSIGKTDAPLRPAIVETQPEKKVVVPLNEGYLSLLTNNGATVKLRRGKNSYAFEVKQGNQLSISKLTPGRYLLEIKHTDDYEPLAESVDVKPREVLTLDRSLRAKYGNLVLNLGPQAGPDVLVKLNGAQVTASQLAFAEGRLRIARIPLGVQELSLSKPGYNAWSGTLTVRASECDNSFNITLDKAAITLNIRALPNTQVFLNGLFRGKVPLEGALVLSELDPGPHKLRFELDGYETAEVERTLTLERRTETIEVPLTPLVEDAEFSDHFDPTYPNWWSAPTAKPSAPPEWQLSTKLPIGRHIKGERLGLAYDNPRPNRNYNLYANFTLVMSVRCQGTQGAAWVVRALDEQNYYLFELDRIQSVLKLYRYQNGQAKPIGQQNIPAKLTGQDETYRIILVAEGSKFRHTIYTPTQGAVTVGTFTDESLKRGGIGLRASAGIEMFVQEFTIKPLK